ncbi:nucleic-acid-binding protein from transposon X-element [Trichonephila clavipes]|nr:nucleic-acid-binding protein from transposon X-element [Trichonephila clavipes]
MLLFFLSLPKKNSNKDVYNITELCYMKIKIEPLDKKKGPAQCFRSQEFFHSSKFCTIKSKCVKCGQPHLTSDCKKSKDTEATCCHCQGNHPANFSGKLGPKNPLNKPPPPTKVNFSDERARKRNAAMVAEKQRHQTSTSTPVPPTSTKPKPQPTAPQPAIARPTPKPHSEPKPAPQSSPPKTSQEPSLMSTLKEVQSPQVVELLTTMREIVRIANTEQTQDEKAIELCELLGNHFSPLRTTDSPTVVAGLPSSSKIQKFYTTAVNVTTIEYEGLTNNITVCSLYRSPSSPINSFIPDLIKIFRNRTQCIAVVDYNAKHSTWNRNRLGNPAGTKLLNYAKTCGFVILAPADPTRIPQLQGNQPSVFDLGVFCGLNNIAV